MLTIKTSQQLVFFFFVAAISVFTELETRVLSLVKEVKSCSNQVQVKSQSLILET